MKVVIIKKRIMWIIRNVWFIALLEYMKFMSVHNIIFFIVVNRISVSIGVLPLVIDKSYMSLNVWDFFGRSLRWIVLYDQEALYNDLDVFLNQDLKEVTKCTWLLKADEEDALYESWAMHKAGDGTSFDSSKYKKLAKDIQLIEKQYKKEKFSFDEHCFAGLEFIIAKYFGNLVRIRREC